MAQIGVGCQPEHSPACAVLSAVKIELMLADSVDHYGAHSKHSMLSQQSKFVCSSACSSAYVQLAVRISVRIAVCIEVSVHTAQKARGYHRWLYTHRL